MRILGPACQQCGAHKEPYQLRYLCDHCNKEMEPDGPRLSGYCVSDVSGIDGDDLDFCSWEHAILFLRKIPINNFETIGIPDLTPRGGVGCSTVDFWKAVKMEELS